MTTPKREEIEAKAIERFFEDQNSKGFKTSITPAREELKESGYYLESRNELMRGEGYEALDYLERIARESGFELVKAKKDNRYCEDLEIFPIEAILREGAFATGGRGSGKTNLLKLLVVEALKRKVRVKVFDPTLAWKTFFLERIKVKRKSYTPSLWNRTYDTSRLSVLENRNFVSEMLAKDVEEAIVSTDMGYKPSCLVVIEEAQNIIPSHSLRAKRFLEISRFITQSRNFGMSYILSTQRCASVDVNAIEVSGIRYFFKLEGERNLRKVRFWLPKFVVWRLRDLKVGEAYIQFGSKFRLARLPKFEICNKAKIAIKTRDISNPNATVMS